MGLSGTNETLDCNLCSNPGTFLYAQESAVVASNVRRFLDKTFTLWRCVNCGSLHSKEPVDLDAYYAHYPLKQHRLGYLTRVAYRNRIRILRRSGLKKHHKLLDFGCGRGLFISLLRSLGYCNVAGYDPHDEQYADQTPLNDQYDFVCSFGVIEHLEQPADHVRQLNELLVENGTAVIATPDADGLDLQRGDALLLHQPYHQHILSRRALNWLATQSGLSMVNVGQRNWSDTLHPAVNSRFSTNYIEQAGDFDSLFESPKLKMILTSPRLLFSLLAGYFFPRPGYMICQLQKRYPVVKTA